MGVGVLMTMRREALTAIVESQPSDPSKEPNEFGAPVFRPIVLTLPHPGL